MSPPDAVSRSGAASAAQGGKANSGTWNETTNNYYPGPPPEITWPVLVGDPPLLASAFQPRPAVRDQILAARHEGTDVVLSQPGTRVLAGGGGVGKSQLAAWFFQEALDAYPDGLVIWVNAGTPEQVITAYARAAGKLGLAGVTGTNLTADATAFREWLPTTDRPWLIVLDDVTDPAHLTGWWPPNRPKGWTLATTRLHDATLASGGRQQIDLGVYAPSESVAYLVKRLPENLVDDHVEALADTLGHLPLALSHAAAYQIDQGIGCAEYLARYADEERTLTDLMPAGADPDGYGRPVAVALLLALDAADRAEPVGLARRAMALAALLDPDGHPEELWATQAVCDYLSGPRKRWWQRGRRRQVSPEETRSVLRLLHRYGLLTHAPGDARAVRIHALTARAAREAPDLHVAAAIQPAADALLALWPEIDHKSTPLMQALRANTTTLADLAADRLWQPDGHLLLFRAGNSLLNAGLYRPAIEYWHRVVAPAERLLGDQHNHTLAARQNLASSYRQAGRFEDAIALQETVVTDRERTLGAQHSTTFTARENLAASYWKAGRTEDAIALQETVVTDRERTLGAQHPATLNARVGLAAAYWQAGRTDDAIIIEEKVVTDRERTLGAQHPDTLTARNNLAHSYWQSGRRNNAMALMEQVVDDLAQVIGAEHPHTDAAAETLRGWRNEAASE